MSREVNGGGKEACPSGFPHTAEDFWVVVSLRKTEGKKEFGNNL